MKWWWSPGRKRAWLNQEAAYWDARFNAFWRIAGDRPNPADCGLSYIERYERDQARLEALKPEGWTREIEARRWNSWNPKLRRWTA